MLSWEGGDIGNLAAVEWAATGLRFFPCVNLFGINTIMDIPIRFINCIFNGDYVMVNYRRCNGRICDSRVDSALKRFFSSMF